MLFDLPRLQSQSLGPLGSARESKAEVGHALICLICDLLYTEVCSELIDSLFELHQDGLNLLHQIVDRLQARTVQ